MYVYSSVTDFCAYDYALCAWYSHTGVRERIQRVHLQHRLTRVYLDRSLHSRAHRQAKAGQGAAGCRSEDWCLNK